MDREEARQRLLEAAEELFYTRGIHAVGIDQIRSRSGVSLARLYELFPSKQHLVAGYLRHRDERWRQRLAAHVERTAPEGSPRVRLLAVFDWLAVWFAEPGYRGCAFINAWGEAGPSDALVADAVHDHKIAFRGYLTRLAGEHVKNETVDQLYMLAEGATVTAGIHGSHAANHARAAADALLAAQSAR